jgi:hypothetical protein
MTSRAFHPLRALMLTVLAVLAVSGCDRTAPPAVDGKTPIEATPSTDARADMRGRWTIDPDRLAEQPFLREMPPEQRQLALEMSQNLLASMTVRFGDDTYAITTGGKTIEGRYAIVEERGADLVLALTEGEGGTTEQVQLRVDSRGLVMTSGADVLPLRRRAEAEDEDKAEAAEAAPTKEPLKIAAPPAGE